MVRIFTDPRCLEHRAPPGFPECPERLERVTRRLRARGLLLEPPSARQPEETRAAIVAVHDEGYVRRLRSAVERGDGLIDSADNPLSAGTWPAAWAAVECALAAVDWALEEPGRASAGRASAGRASAGRAAFAAVRPPGHHAERSTAMGFCYFNSAAVAAEHAIRRHGLERVAVFDFDVHHGNGTQHLFEERGDVLYASIHQSPFYPGTGAESETGFGDGEGATLNLPLPAGSGDADYARAFEETVWPALERFAPRLLVVSAGFDAFRGDPLGGMRVSAGAFGCWGETIAAWAAELCGGRSVSLLEGGYDLARLGELVERYLTGLAGVAQGSRKEV